MPGMNGWEFLEIVRDNDRTKDIPVIVLTSYSDSQNRKTGRLFEVAAFMQKPIDLEKLRSVLDNAIYTRNPKNT
jgi:CheY-like chemotaxis protein